MKILSSISGLLLLATVCLGGTAAAKDPDVLVLGDSVSFSYIASVGYDFFYTDPENFVGFPDDLASALDLNVVNAACPGETTGSFLSATAPDNGCRSFRSYFPLHVDYSATQLEFAKKYLKSHRDVRLVTLLLGANDGFLLEQACAYDPTCIQNGGQALAYSIATNMNAILAALRATGYRGAIVVANYWSADYSDPVATGGVMLVNAAAEYPAAAYGAVVADVFTAFKNAVAKNPFANGNTCKAGFLNPDVTTQFLCDVHPAQVGHRLIARTIAKAYRATDPR
jgi:lysophospholipase L1-like esterase